MDDLFLRVFSKSWIKPGACRICSALPTVSGGFVVKTVFGQASSQSRVYLAPPAFKYRKFYGAFER